MPIQPFTFRVRPFNAFGVQHKRDRNELYQLGLYILVNPGFSSAAARKKYFTNKIKTEGEQCCKQVTMKLFEWKTIEMSTSPDFWDKSKGKGNGCPELLAEEPERVKFIKWLELQGLEDWLNPQVTITSKPKYRYKYLVEDEGNNTFKMIDRIDCWKTKRKK